MVDTKTAVSEKPILFSGPMVQAILSGAKTQTRRVIKPQPDTIYEGYPYRRMAKDAKDYDCERQDLIRCPYGAVGDRLWVRESFGLVPATAYGNSVPHRVNPNNPADVAIYRAGWDRVWEPPTKPSIFMPRWASRLTLEISEVRAERLHDISLEDIRAEGMDLTIRNEDGVTWQAADFVSRERRWARDCFAALWDSINGKKPGCDFASSPWVWVVSFRVIETAP